jgi:ketosteroid isomerase-like protein
MLGQAKHPRAIIALCVFMVVAIAAVAIFESSDGFLAGTGDPTAQIEAEYSSHLANIHSMNVSAIEQDYSSDASVEFTAVGQQSDGNYTGQENIAHLFGGALFTQFAVPTFSLVNSTVKVNGNKATLDSNFFINGYDTDANDQNARVTTQVHYVRQGADWVISFEAWTFTFYNDTGGNDNGD